MAYPAKEFGDPGRLGMLIDKDDLEKYFVVDADLDKQTRKNGNYTRRAPALKKATPRKTRLLKKRPLHILPVSRRMGPMVIPRPTTAWTG